MHVFYMRVANGNDTKRNNDSGGGWERNYLHECVKWEDENERNDEWKKKTTRKFVYKRHILSLSLPLSFFFSHFRHVDTYTHIVQVN